MHVSDDIVFLTGLVGWPVGHSRSPAMHNAAFAASGIAGIYVPLPVPPTRLAAAAAGLAALGFCGANVTIPHKQAIMAHLDRFSAVAGVIGAVNALVVQPDGSLLGDNTDAPGFLADLDEQGVDMTEIVAGGALLLGAGGSARAIAYALAVRGVPTVVAARRDDQARNLVDGLRPHLSSSDSSGFLLAHGAWAELPELGSRPTLVVNCTPLGMSPRVDASPWPQGLGFRSGQIVYDLVYNPAETRLMAHARACGARAINGLGMLLHQGALSWQAWTGRPAPVDAMRKALAAAEIHST